MLSKNQIKFINALKQKKGRNELQLFVAEGVKTVLEIISSGIVVKQVFGTTGFFENLIVKENIEKVEIKPNELERISFLTTPNEVLAVCEMPKYVFQLEALKGNLTLVLDDIKDPGNLGTIIRIADWFGIEQIVCSTESADVYNPKVVQATMGSIARVKVFYADLNDLLSQCSSLKLPVYGAFLDGENIYTEKLVSEGLIVIGNESRGISDSIAAFVTNKIKIPSFSHYKSGSGEAESLNAAIATSIICSEFRRRA